MPVWQQYQNKWYEGAIAPTDNLLLVTGKQPGKDYQVVVFDFDGHFNPDMLREVYDAFIKICPHQWIHKMVITAHSGLHVYTICDTKVEIRGTQKRKIKPGIYPPYVNGIDIRACGSVVFYPPTQFLGSQEYRFIWNDPSPRLAPSEQVKLLISALYVDAEVTSQDAIAVPLVSQLPPADETCNQEIANMRLPFRQLISPGAPEIHALAASTGCLEELYWKGLFVEARGRGVSDETIMRLLASYQPAFNISETLEQLKYVGRTPFRNSTLERMFPWYKAPAKSNAEVIE